MRRRTRQQKVSQPQWSKTRREARCGSEMNVSKRDTLSLASYFRFLDAGARRVFRRATEEAFREILAFRDLALIGALTRARFLEGILTAWRVFFLDGL